MLLLNFAHPLTPAQKAQARTLLGEKRAPRVIDVPAHFDQARPFAEQARDLVHAAGLSPKRWQTAAFAINLPGHSAFAACLLAEVHGRTGYFPAILRLRPDASAPATTFELAEIINLQDLRTIARQTR